MQTEHVQITTIVATATAAFGFVLRAHFSRDRSMLDWVPRRVSCRRTFGFCWCKIISRLNDILSLKIYYVQSSSQIIATNKPTLSFLLAGCPSCRPTNNVGTLKDKGRESSAVRLKAEALTNGLIDCLVWCRIPDSIGKDIEKVCQSIYPLHDVYVRKVKILKKPKFDRMYDAVCNRLFLNVIIKCVGSKVVRIDPLHFLVGCRKRRLNQAPSFLS